MDPPLFPLINSEEFLIVRHSYLNNRDLDLDKTVEEAKSLEKHTYGRRVVPGLEADIVSLPNGRIALTHQNFIPLSEEKYNRLVSIGIATSLEEVIKNVTDFTHRTKERLVICLEAKPITTSETIFIAVKMLKESGITDAYFDSFYGGRLDMIRQANSFHGTNYLTSMHLVGQIGPYPIAMSKPEVHQEITTIPYRMALGKPQGPLIYGAVGSVDTLSRIADDPSVVGAYVRTKEKWSLTMLFNSITNTKNLRDHTYTEGRN